jgi:hypothetical protein
MIFIDSAEESKMENLIKEKQKFFEKIDNSIRINYFIRNESEKEISKFYIKICFDFLHRLDLLELID